jgi:ABC-type uncharacterized transport system ATPase subunit
MSTEAMSTEAMKAKVIADEITNYVNTFSRRDEFNEAMSREHRTLQQSFTRLCLKWIEHVSKEEYRTDARNEQSKEICQKIVTDFKEKNGGFLPSEFLGFI